MQYIPKHEAIKDTLGIMRTVKTLTRLRMRSLVRVFAVRVTSYWTSIYGAGKRRKHCPTCANLN